jgi:Ras-related protein Rab-1A
MNDDFDYLFKVVILGSSGAGKSSLLLRFADNFFTTDFISTIGVDFKIRRLDVDGDAVKLQIWDTAGQDRFRTIVRSYYRGANGIILVYDITDRQSFDAIPLWMSEFEGQISFGASCVLVGNKTDLEEKRAVSKNEAEDFAKRLGMPFMEASAKDAVHVDDVFFKLASAMRARAGPVSPICPPIDPIPHVWRSGVRPSILERIQLCC